MGIHRKIFVRVLVVALAVSIFAVAADACSVCFGDPDHAQTKGMNAAIFTLLGVTGGVVSMVLAFGVTIALRIRRFERAAQAGETA
jgi:uncharacterized membrane protein